MCARGRPQGSALIDLSITRDDLIEAGVPPEFVSRETLGRLAIYAEDLVKWQRQINLVSDSTLPTIWSRHFVDSAQLAPHAGRADNWLDLGSGAGFPGLVIAILLSEKPNFSMTLVESNGKKCAFLRNVAHRTGVGVRVVQKRLESLDYADIGPVDIVSARALATVDGLLAFGEPWLSRGAKGLFLKGAGLNDELEIARKRWKYVARRESSATDPEGSILVVEGLQRRDVKSDDDRADIPNV